LGREPRTEGRHLPTWRLGALTVARLPTIIPTAKKADPSRFLEDYLCAHLRHENPCLETSHRRQVAADECLQRICTEQGLDPRAWRVVLVAYTYPTYQVTVSERSAIDRLGDVVR